MAGREFLTNDSVAGEYFSRWEVSCGSKEADWAVVKERMDNAVIPLVREAKQDFRVLAEPKRSETWVMLRIRGRSDEREVGRVGPERMREGRVHSLLLSGFWRGGGPMMAPSIKVIGMGSGAGSWVGEEEKRPRREDCRRIALGRGCSAGLELRRLEISVTLLGEIAFKSTKVRFRGADVVPRRVFRAVMPADEWQASAMRRAVAMASRGGTILSMMSA